MTKIIPFSKRDEAIAEYSEKIKKSLPEGAKFECYFATNGQLKARIDSPLTLSEVESFLRQNQLVKP